MFIKLIVNCNGDVKEIVFNTRYIITISNNRITYGKFDKYDTYLLCNGQQERFERIFNKGR